MTLAVSIDQLQCSRANFRLGPISLEVAAGARVAIVGPSGSGKTTLLRCLAGLQKPDSGTIKVGDTIVDNENTRLAPAERQLGLVFQDGALWPHMSALKHLRFAAPGLSKKDALSLLERGGILAQAKKKPGTMSGGEAQRLGLLRALAPNPAVLLLDEPLRSVDVHQRDSLVLLLRSMCNERNVTSILVTKRQRSHDYGVRRARCAGWHERRCSPRRVPWRSDRRRNQRRPRGQDSRRHPK